MDTPGGQDWFIHFQSRGLYGRITHLQPMTWGADGWPVIGAPVEGATYGTPVDAWEKPDGPDYEPLSLQASDDFTGKLELQWQFMGNWHEGFYTLQEGTLRLHAVSQPDESGLLWHCPNALTQKIAAPAFTAEVQLDGSGLQVGEQAGFGLLGGQYAYVALRRTADGLRLVYVQSEGAQHAESILVTENNPDEALTLRMTLVPTGYDTGAVTFEYTKGDRFCWIGEPFQPARHTWVGVRIALFAMPLDGSSHGGYADFASFQVEGVETLE